MAEIDVLHMHTQNKLQEMEMEQKKNIYNFEVRYNSCEDECYEFMVKI